MSDTELLDKSSADPVRRMEVFTGAGGRRRWSAEQKARIVAESYERGETASGVARRHGLTPQQLFAWRRDFRPAAEQRASGSNIEFAPVVLDASYPPRDASISAAPRGRSATIEIEIGSVTVRVAAGIDAATLQIVLRAVRASC
jgi:transposase